MADTGTTGTSSTQGSGSSDKAKDNPDSSFTNQPSFKDKEKAYQADRERLAEEHGIKG